MTNVRRWKQNRRAGYRNFASSRPEDSSSRECSRTRIHSTLWSRTKSIAGYSVTGRCVTHASTCTEMHVWVIRVHRSLHVRVNARAHTRTRAYRAYVHGQSFQYRNSQFVRAFTFEFPLFTFRVVVCRGTKVPVDEEVIVLAKRHSIRRCQPHSCKNLPPGRKYLQEYSSVCVGVLYGMLS